MKILKNKTYRQLKKELLLSRIQVKYLAKKKQKYKEKYEKLLIKFMEVKNGI